MSPFFASDPDLAAWPELPEAIKDGIVAMVWAASRRTIESARLEATITASDRSWSSVV